MLPLYFSDIKAYVKAKLDELSNNEDAMLVASDQAVEDLEKEIEAAVLPSVRKIHLDAPNVLLRDGKLFDKDSIPFPVYEDIGRDSDFIVSPQTLVFSPEGGTQNVMVKAGGSWSVEVGEGKPDVELMEGTFKYLMRVPDDFLRLITLWMDDWERPIQTLVNEDSAEYHKQKNHYLRGTHKKPVGALVRYLQTSSQPPVSVSFIELYSCTSNVALLKSGQYYPEPRIISDDHVLICEPLKFPCLNQITANVLRGIGRAQEAALYDQLAVQPFYIDPDYARLNPLVGERFNAQHQ